jgi:hypothetical protein
MRRDALKRQLHCHKPTHRLCQNECNGSDMTHAPCRIFRFVPRQNSACLSPRRPWEDLHNVSQHDSAWCGEGGGSPDARLAVRL